MAVDSFNTRTGAVVSAGSDYGWTVSGNDTNFALSGRVGVGTTSPQKLVHLSGNNTATMRLQDTSASSNIGELTVTNDFVGIGANRDNTTGAVFNSGKTTASVFMRATGGDSYVLLSTTPTNNTGPIERMRVDKDGNVGIGTTSPGGKLDVPSAGARGTFGARFSNTSNYSVASMPTSAVKAGAAAVGYYPAFDAGYMSGDVNTGFYGFVPTGGHGGGASAAIFDRPDTNLRTIFMGGTSVNDFTFVQKTINTSTGATLFAIDASGKVRAAPLAGKGTGLVAADNNGELLFCPDGYYAALYGVVGDGTTDNSANLNALLTAAGDNALIRLPAGTIVLSGQVQPRAGQTICGMGMYITTLKFTGGATPTVFIDEKDRVTVRDLGIDHNGQGSHCLQAQKSNHLTVRNCFMFGSPTPLNLQYKTSASYANACSDVLVEKCHFVGGSGQYVLFSTYSHQCRFANNYFENVGQAAINISAGKNLVIAGNVIVGLGSDVNYGGIRLTPCDYSTVTGNKVRLTGVGITINGGLANTVTGNELAETGSMGIRLNWNNLSGDTRHANWNTIGGNAIFNAYNSGTTGEAVYLEDAGEPDGCQGNVCYGNTAFDNRGPVHINKVYRQVITGGGPSFPNKFDSASTNSHVAIGP